MQRYKEALSIYPRLQSAKLLLRKPVESDIATIIAIAGDWKISSQLARVPFPYGESEARFFLSSVVPHELAWAIVERSSGAMVGVAGLSPSDDFSEAISLGYYVARERWGEGIATEAASVVLAFAIGLVGREYLSARYFIDNPASGRVLEKLGFSRSGVDEQTCLATGSAKQSIYMRLS